MHNVKLSTDYARHNESLENDVINAIDPLAIPSVVLRAIESVLSSSHSSSQFGGFSNVILFEFLENVIVNTQDIFNVH